MSDASDQVDDLERLSSLRAAGALTDEEFEAEKVRVLGPVQWDEPALVAPIAPADVPAVEPYPVAYEVEYPPRLSRWKTLLRLPLLLPALIFLYIIQAVLAYALIPIGWVTVFWRKKYPQWLFAATTGALAYIARYQAYALLQTDKYPSFDADSSPVSLTFAEPPPAQLSRWRVVFWKLLLLIPHFFVLGALQAALFVVTVIAWFGILFTGSYPRGLFGFTTGVMRWHFRVAAYLASLNDRYPPFALSSGAGPAGKTTVAVAAIGGGFLAAGFGALITAAVVAGNTPDRQQIDYSALLQGQANSSVAYSGTDGRVFVALIRAYDPGDSMVQLLKPGAGEKLVVFEWSVRNVGGSSVNIPGDIAELKYFDGAIHRRGAEIVVVGNGVAPRKISGRTTATVRAAFVLPGNANPLALDFQAAFTGRGGIRYEFR